MPATITRQESKRRKNDRARALAIEKRNYSAEDKAAIRSLHRERIAGALAMLENEDGLARFVESRQLCPHLTPLGAALAAYEAPGQLVGSMAYWKAAGHRVRKGEIACAYTTRAPAFWPLPMFSAAQTDYPQEYTEAAEDELALPSDGLLAEMARSIRDAFAATGRKTATLNKWTEVEAV